MDIASPDAPHNTFYTIIFATPALPLQTTASQSWNSWRSYSLINGEKESFAIDWTGLIVFCFSKDRVGQLYWRLETHGPIHPRLEDEDDGGLCLN